MNPGSIVSVAQWYSTLCNIENQSVLSSSCILYSDFLHLFNFLFMHDILQSADEIQLYNNLPGLANK